MAPSIFHLPLQEFHRALGCQCALPPVLLQEQRDQLVADLLRPPGTRIGVDDIKLDLGRGINAGRLERHVPADLLDEPVLVSRLGYTNALDHRQAVPSQRLLLQSRNALLIFLSGARLQGVRHPWLLVKDQRTRGVLQDGEMRDLKSNQAPCQHQNKNYSLPMALAGTMRISWHFQFKADR